METISSLAQIDAKLRKVNEAAAQSDAAVRGVFNGFQMDFDEFYKELPKDPFSPEYFAFQMQMYDTLAGKKYKVSNEVSVLDVTSSITCPFPYNSRNHDTAGMHLSSLGFVIGHMKLAPGSKIIEFGAGWGNTTLALALLGHQVTVVEIEPRFCELIRQRAKLNNVSINVINGDFLSCESMTEQFDAALFYECFHHCSDHMRLLRGLQKVVKPTGQLFLGAEPITTDFPVPWGLRLDGESLWAIRQNGWMELGFREDYFKEALRRTGWSGSSQRSLDCGFSNLWTIKRTVTEPVHIAASDPTVQSPLGKQNGRVVIGSAANGYVLWGPYLELSAGTWEAHVHLAAGSLRKGLIQGDVSTDLGTRIVAHRELNLNGATGDVLTIPFSLKEASSNVEVRVCLKTPAELDIEAVSFVPRQLAPNTAPWEAPVSSTASRSWRSLTKRALLKVISLVDRSS